MDPEIIELMEQMKQETLKHEQTASELSKTAKQLLKKLKETNIEDLVSKSER